MKPSTREWIKKAESDYQLALTLARRRKTLVRDQACFMFQQSAEKYLKARLEEANLPFPKTHQLQDLVTLTLPGSPSGPHCPLLQAA
jgi:HEPN domain-containing protein